MKKLAAIGLAVALFTASLFGVGAPVFVGATTDYITNSGGTITFVYSNRSRVVFHRGNSTMRITNDISGQSLVINAGTIDDSAAIRQEYSFGTSQGAVPGYIWGFTLTTNGFILGDGVGSLFLNGTRNDGILRLPSTGIKAEGTVNFTNLPGTGSFVAIASDGGLFRTNVPTATLITNFDGIVITNGVASVIASATRTGGALTNITLNAQGPQVVHADGSTNVNLVAIMNWAAGLQRPVTLLITNRTATPRTFSLGATTNNWIGLGTITAPLQVTNALWVTMENLGTSNVVYAAAYAANPTN